MASRGRRNPDSRTKKTNNVLNCFFLKGPAGLYIFRGKQTTRQARPASETIMEYGQNSDCFGSIPLEEYLSAVFIPSLNSNINVMHQTNKVLC